MLWPGRTLRSGLLTREVDQARPQHRPSTHTAWPSAVGFLQCFLRLRPLRVETRSSCEAVRRFYLHEHAREGPFIRFAPGAPGACAVRSGHLVHGIDAPTSRPVPGMFVKGCRRGRTVRRGPGRSATLSAAGEPTTILGGPDDNFDRVGPGGPCRCGARDQGIRPARAESVLLEARFRPYQRHTTWSGTNAATRRRRSWAPLTSLRPASAFAPVIPSAGRPVRSPCSENSDSSSRLDERPGEDQRRTLLGRPGRGETGRVLSTRGLIDFCFRWVHRCDVLGTCTRVSWGHDRPHGWRSRVGSWTTAFRNHTSLQRTEASCSLR